MKLTGFDARHFLRQHWQKKPLLIRQALPDFCDIISPEELAGLACEPEVESRIVHTRRSGYVLQTGHFTEKDFTTLTAKNWTLLVQAVDQYLSKAKELLHAVSFVPGWRLDDLMISYATAGGGVGPHFDYYDVFLIQGQGTRTWQLGQRCNANDAVLDCSGLKLLKHFHESETFVLNTGDVLYIPPGVAHWGISSNNSLSYSIGFRAPDTEEMLLGFSEYLTRNSSPDERYTDPPLDPANILPGEISKSAISKARRQLLKLLRDETEFARWFGNEMTLPRYPQAVVPSRRFPALDKSGLHLRTALWSRLAWQRHENTIIISANGESFSLRYSGKLQKLLQQLAGPAIIEAAPWLNSQVCRQLLQTLFQRGVIVEVKNQP